MLAGMNFLQPYLLSTHLELPNADMGKVTGTLAIITEIVTVIFIVPIGALSDRIGRRPLIAAGIFLFGLGYALSGFATSLLELYFYRLCFFAFGAACLSATLATISNDYPEETSRGKLIGVTNVMNTLGVAFVALVLAKIPEQLTARGWGPVPAGEAMFLVAGGLCFFSAVVFQFGLKSGVPVVTQERPSFKQLVLSGVRNGRNPRILLSYAAAFTARGDLALKGVFISAWATVVAPDLGLTRAEALGAVGVWVGITNIAAGLLWNPVFGWIMGPAESRDQPGARHGHRGNRFFIDGAVRRPNRHIDYAGPASVGHGCGQRNGSINHPGRSGSAGQRTGIGDCGQRFVRCDWNRRRSAARGLFV